MVLAGDYKGFPNDGELSKIKDAQRTFVMQNRKQAILKAGALNGTIPVLKAAG